MIVVGQNVPSKLHLLLGEPSCNRDAPLSLLRQHYTIPSQFVCSPADPTNLKVCISARLRSIGFATGCRPGRLPVGAACVVRPVLASTGALTHRLIPILILSDRLLPSRVARWT